MKENKTVLIINKDLKFEEIKFPIMNHEVERNEFIFDQLERMARLMQLLADKQGDLDAYTATNVIKLDDYRKK